MGSCLLQQLFRQKIGRMLDPLMIEEVLFPLLLSKKDLPRELLLDLKLTRSCNDEGRSAIIQTLRSGATKNSSPFTNTGGRYKGAKDGFKLRIGKNSSKMRRLCSLRASWGSIDILNELRNLKYPQIGLDRRDNYFLRLEEEHINVKKSGTRIHRQHRRRTNELHRHNTLEFVNDYLEYALNTRSDPCLVWNQRDRTIRS
jgi:hypothetical protein